MEMKVSALIGDYYHPGDYLQRGLEDVLEEGNLGLEVRYITDPGELDWSGVNSNDLLILARAGWISPDERDEYWLSPREEGRLHEFVSDGGGLLVLHSGLASYPRDGDFDRLVRGHFDYHPEGLKSVRIRATGEHPVVEGVEGFVVEDEYYVVEVREGETNIVLTAATEGYEPTPAGWVHSVGGGRVGCITPGHTPEVLSSPGMKELLANTVNWALGRD